MIKRGFSLAELLITLAIIGFLAGLVVPSLMKGVHNSQTKTKYRKALNNVAGIIDMEIMQGGMVANSSPESAMELFKILDSKLSVRDYAPAKNTGESYSIHDLVDTPSDTAATIKYHEQDDVGKSASPWINTEDGMSYQVLANIGSRRLPLLSKSRILEQFSEPNAKEKPFPRQSVARFLVLVDTNGVLKGPNEALQDWAPENKNDIYGSEKIDFKNKDRLYIYIGYDGATSGSIKNTITGRITSGMK